MKDIKDFTVHDYILNGVIFTMNILLNYQIMHAIDSSYCLTERKCFCLFYLISYLCLDTEHRLVIPKFLILGVAVKKETNLNTS